MQIIQFGTDGWRAEIAKEFTFDSLSRVCVGTANCLKSTQDKRAVLVGYDKRFLSAEFAAWAAALFAEQGFKVHMSKEALPTPVLSWCAKHYDNVAGAVMITASHNPPTYNGFKFKEVSGCSALLNTTQEFERYISDTPARAFDKNLFDHYVSDKTIEYFDPMPQYNQSLLSNVDVGAIAKANLNVAVDTMYGVGAGHFENILNSIDVKNSVIHDEDNPGFMGRAPEPVEKNLKELAELVKSKKAHAGFANDGDADRLGAYDENGDYFSTQKILSVVYWHMLHNRNKQWNIARSVSTTCMVDKIAEAHGFKAIETKVGFKFIAEAMLKNEAQIGGEESGGIGTDDHLPERDGFLTALLLLEAMAVSGKGLSELYADICKSYRPYEYTRNDLKVDKALMQACLDKLRQDPPKQWDGFEVERVVDIDGFKFYMQDGSWLLIRPSGTEPLFRIYAETDSLQNSEKLCASAVDFVENCR